MLIQRLLAAIVLIPLVFICLFFLPMQGFVTAIVIICALASWEWAQFLSLKSLKHRVVFTSVSTLFIFVVYSLSTEYLLITRIVLLCALAWWLVALLLVMSYPKTMIFWRNRLVKVLFACFTLLPFLIGTIELRQIDYSLNPSKGAFLLLYVLILVWATDSGAYFAGRKFGKKKLAPKVSPGKTVEGLAGGVILALIIAAFVYLSGYFTVSLRSLMISSVCAIFVSVLGDLTESMFKRQANIKDSGHLIPGHGGILDRIDSLTAAIPVFSALSLYLL